MHTVPIAVKIFITVGLLGAGGVLVGVPAVGMRSGIRDERTRLRKVYSVRNRRLFWAWAIAFPSRSLWEASLVSSFTQAGTGSRPR